MTTASAPGKIILIGEHAVVYGRPAIAAPVWSVRAFATISDSATNQGCTIFAPDINLQLCLAQTGNDQPLALITRLTLAQLGIQSEPDWQIELRSELPIAGGLGSGAALSAALVRAIFAHAGQPIADHLVSEIVYESERFYHGTPSGIDNTVIAFGVPIWFVKGETPLPFQAGNTLHLLIADSGVRSPTKATVAAVRQAWTKERNRYEGWFDEIGAIAQQARQAIQQGNRLALGQLFDQNHALLQQIGVSSPLLDQLVAAARTAGALGAKLSGGGKGGNIIALIEPELSDSVTESLLRTGAQRVLATML